MRDREQIRRLANAVLLLRGARIAGLTVVAVLVMLVATGALKH